MVDSGDCTGRFLRYVFVPLVPQQSDVDGFALLRRTLEHNAWKGSLLASDCASASASKSVRCHSSEEPSALFLRPGRKPADRTFEPPSLGRRREPQTDQNKNRRSSPIGGRPPQPHRASGDRCTEVGAAVLRTRESSPRDLFRARSDGGPARRLTHRIDLTQSDLGRRGGASCLDEARVASLIQNFSPCSPWPPAERREHRTKAS